VHQQAGQICLPHTAGAFNSGRLSDVSSFVLHLDSSISDSKEASDYEQRKACRQGPCLASRGHGLAMMVSGAIAEELMNGHLSQRAFTVMVQAGGSLQQMDKIRLLRRSLVTALMALGKLRL